jgi:hypothetical protein
MNRSILLFTLFLVFSATGLGRLCAQTPTDDLMMDKGQICVALTYTHDAWDEYWEGALQRSNGNIGTLTRQTIMPMFSLGITDRINVLAALPWVKTEASDKQVTSLFVERHLKIGIDSLKQLINNGLTVRHLQF